MKIGICDDVEEMRNHLKTLLLRYIPDATILEYSSGEVLLTALQNAPPPDLLFLDIYMTGINGMEVAEVIRTHDQNLPILFLTSAPEFAVASYRVQAQDYLLKPVDEAILRQTLDRQLARLAQDEARILFPSNRGILQIPLSNIIYIEAVSRILRLVQTDGTIVEGSDTIQSMTATLEKFPQFVRPHRSYLVNLQHVIQLDKDGFRVTTGTCIPISRSHMSNMKQQYVNQILDK